MAAVVARRDRRFRTGRRDKYLALSFDDGPSPLTPAILDLLGECGASGTFFLLGRELTARSDVVRRMAAEGHELANHTFSHTRIGTMSPGKLQWELARTSDLIDEIAGRRPRLLRPPYGADAALAGPVASSLGMITVLWSVNPKDWNGKSAEAITRTVLSAASPGAVVVLHDGGGDRRPTLEALQTVVPQLREWGYSLVTVSELLERSPQARRRVIPSSRRGLHVRSLLSSDRRTPRTWRRRRRPGHAPLRRDQAAG